MTNEKLESIRACIDRGTVSGDRIVLEMIYKNGKQKVYTGIKSITQDYLTFHTEMVNKKIESIKAYIDSSYLGRDCAVLEIEYENGKRKTYTGINPVEQNYLTIDNVISYLTEYKNPEENPKENHKKQNKDRSNL